MADSDRADVRAWVAGQLTWEHRLRELETEAEATEGPAAEPAVAPAGKPSRPGLVGMAHPLTR